MSNIINIKDLRFCWPGNDIDTLAIDSLTIDSGEKVFIRGASGSGKTTLLNLLSGVSESNEGCVEVLGQDIKALRPAERDRFRAQHIGYIFQAFNLVPYLSMHENVALACHFSKAREARALSQSNGLEVEVERLLEHLELGKDLIGKPVTNLSIGQQQRVAAARALIGRPEIIIADEPTSSLDKDLQQRFLELLFQEVEACGSTLVFVSHDASIESLFDRTIQLSAINRVQELEA